jgi:hypothetical protein
MAPSMASTAKHGIYGQMASMEIDDIYDVTSLGA